MHGAEVDRMVAELVHFIQTVSRSNLRNATR